MIEQTSGGETRKSKGRRDLRERQYASGLGGKSGDSLLGARGKGTKRRGGEENIFT